MKLATLAAALAISLACVAGAHGQAYPSRPVTIIVPFPAGGPTDTLARILSERMRTALGQTVIVENVTGAGASIGVELIPDHVRKAPNFQMPQFVVPPEGISFKDVITDFEKRLIESTLEAAGGVQKRAAELLHIKPTTLNEMIKRYEIRPRRKRTANGNGAEPAVSPGSDAAVPKPADTPAHAGSIAPVFDDK